MKAVGINLITARIFCRHLLTNMNLIKIRFNHGISPWNHHVNSCSLIRFDVISFKPSFMWINLDATFGRKFNFLTLSGRTTRFPANPWLQHCYLQCLLIRKLVVHQTLSLLCLFRCEQKVFPKATTFSAKLTRKLHCFAE